MSAIILVIFTALSVPLISYLIKKYRFRKFVNKIPGPEGRFIFGSALEFLRCPQNRRIELIESKFEEYGNLFRWWLGFQPVITVGNAEDAQVILTSNVNIDKSMIYKLAEPWIGTGLLTSKGKKWATRRKLLTPAFHFSTLNLFINTMVEKSNILLKKLEVEENSEEFDVYPYMNNCSLDIICETAMGVKVKAQEEGSEYIPALKELGDIILARSFSPWLWLDWIYAFSSYSKKQEKVLQILHGFTLKVIEQKKSERQNQKTNLKTEADDEFGTIRKKPFLNLLLDISDKQGAAFSNSDLREEVDTFMFGGHDTVAAATSWAIFLIGLHPEVQEKLHEEIISVFGQSEQDPTMEDLRQLKYLEMVVKECLRLFPSVIIVSRDLTEDVILSGYKVPAGATVDISIYQIHRDARYFEKPNDSYPEHFLPEKCSNRHPYAYIPFSAGPRNCIGQKFAMLEEKILLSSLLRRYKIEALQKFEDISRVPETVLRPGNGIKVRISRRPKL